MTSSCIKFQHPVMLYNYVHFRCISEYKIILNPGFMFYVFLVALASMNLLC